MKDKIILYTIGCPKCMVLEKKLNAAGINYDVCTNQQEMMEKGLIKLPILKVNDKYYSFNEAVNYINERS